MQQIFLNGDRLTSMKKIKLKANDRVIFGNSSAFLFRNQDKSKESEVQDTKENPVTYEYAMSEKTAKDNAEEHKRKEEERKAMEEETAKKLSELKNQQEKEKAEAEQQRAKMQKEYEAMLAQMKAEIESKKNDEDA